MFVKVGLSKNGNKFYCLGYYEDTLPIILTFDKRNVFGFCKSVGFTIPEEIGTYKIF